MIFDLWDTLALWPSNAFDEVKRELARHIDDVDRVWETTYQSVGAYATTSRGTSDPANRQTGHRSIRARPASSSV